jgi:hypothetical protein
MVPVNASRVLNSAIHEWELAVHPVFGSAVFSLPKANHLGNLWWSIKEEEEDASMLKIEMQKNESNHIVPSKRRFNYYCLYDDS